MKVLNLYAGIGGNRKLWKDVDVVAIENNPKIAKMYQEFFPNDKVIITDAHQYLLDHFNEFDFMWSSPPCPTHSRIRKARHDQNPPIYPNMKLYEEILLLQGYAKCKWVVENVISWYKPLIIPHDVGRHYFWSNFHISPFKIKTRGHMLPNKELMKIKGFEVNDTTILRNCVEPRLGLHVFNCAFKDKQTYLKTTTN